jgi:hypothetical protein
VSKRDIINDMKSELQNSSDDLDEEDDEDLEASIWMPVIMDNKIAVG